MEINLDAIEKMRDEIRFARVQGAFKLVHISALNKADAALYEAKKLKAWADELQRQNKEQREAYEAEISRLKGV